MGSWCSERRKGKKEGKSKRTGEGVKEGGKEEAGDKLLPVPSA